MSGVVLGPRDPEWWGKVTPKAAEDWGNTQQFDPDSWFVIPEFGIRPADVEFKGFSRPIIALANPERAEAIRRLVRSVRVLARQHFSTLGDLNAEYTEWRASADLRWGTERRRVAVMYRSAMAWLQLRNRNSEVMLDDLLWIASLIAIWATGGAQTAFEEIVRRRQQPLAASRNPRPGARSSIKDRIEAQMAFDRAADVPFKDFLDAWGNDPKGGLRLTILREGRGKFKVTDEEASSGQIEEQTYTLGSLQTMYSSIKSSGRR